MKPQDSNVRKLLLTEIGENSDSDTGSDHDSDSE